MKKRNRTLDNISSKIHELEKQGFTPIGISYLDDGGSKPGGDIQNISAGIVSTFSDGGQIGRTLSKIEKSVIPLKVNMEITEFVPDSAMKKNNLFRNNAIPVVYEGVGTEGKGYIPWGAGNRLPNFIFHTAYSLPYTARSLQFQRDEIVGLGVEFKYRCNTYVNGELKTKEIPYKDAGEWLLGKIRSLGEKIRSKNPDGQMVVDMLNIQSGGEMKLGSDEYELRRLEEEYRTWERVSKEVQEFEQNNDLHKHEMACMTDFVAMEMYYPLIGLSRGKPGTDWEPKIVSIRHIPCVAARVEEMDENRNINFVYYSDRWREYSDTVFTCISPKKNEIVDYPALPEMGTLAKLRNIVERKKKVGVRSRPTWFCLPRRMPSMNSLYYTRPTWWSIYTSMAYDYAATLIADRAAARRNATMWGKIIMVNHEYLQQLWNARGCDTAEKREMLRQELKKNIDNFLRKRDNNGATAMFESVLSPDGNTLWDSIKIVDVPMNSNAVADANKTELSEISNVIFLAMGIHTLLIGNDINSTGNSGTAHRELDLLKQKQLAPMLNDYLSFLNFIRDWNDWDPKHGVWRGLQMSLTTLDSSKTGTKTIDSNGEAQN